MLDDKERLDDMPRADETRREAEPAVSQAGAEANPAMELPEIPALATQAAAPAPLYDPPRPERKSRSSTWRLLAAAVALVTLSAAVGSGSTYYLMSKYQQGQKPIGYELMQSPSLTAISSTDGSVESVIPSIYKRVGPSVVAIDVSVGQGFWRASGSGSGFVVDPQGYILTNYHVVDQAAKVKVKFVDGTTLPAKVVGTDRYKDLAVLKVDPPTDRTLVAAPLGDSDKLEVGQMAIAIGNPFGHEFTVTAGIVSALNREIAEEGNTVSIPGAIQTDAAINPGNSGGPLLNSRGEVIGINTAIDGQAGIQANVGLGFAVPINMAKEILPQLMSGQKIQRAFLGVSLSNMNARYARLLDTDVAQGAIVAQVEPGSAAETAGLKDATFDENDLLVTADVITAINGTQVSSAEDVINLIAKQKPGDTVEISILRGKERLTLKATLGSRDAED